MPTRQEYTKQYRIIHPEKFAGYTKKYRAKEEVKMKRRIYQREYMRMVREKAPQKIKKWRSDSSHDIKKIWMVNIGNRDGFFCKKCKTVNHLTLQHKVPKCIGGKYTYENLEILCLACNMNDYHELVKKALKFYFEQD